MVEEVLRSFTKQTVLQESKLAITSKTPVLKSMHVFNIDVLKVLIVVLMQRIRNAPILYNHIIIIHALSTIRILIWKVFKLDQLFFLNIYFVFAAGD